MQKVSSEQSSMVVGESIIQISGEEHSRKRDQPAPRPQELLPDGLEAAGGQVWLPRWATLQPGQGAGSGAGAGEFAGRENQALPGPESSVRVMQGASGWGPWSADPSLVPTPKAPHPCSLDPLTLHLLTWSLIASPLCGSQAKQIWGLVRFSSYFLMSQSLQRFNHFSPVNGWQGAGAQLSAPG